MNDFISQIQDRLTTIKNDMSQSAVMQESIEPKLLALQEKLAELEENTSERWELLKTGVEVALADLEDTYHAIKAVGAKPAELDASAAS